MAGDVTIRKLVTEWGFDIDKKALDGFEKTMDRLKTGVAALGGAVATGTTALFGLAETTSKTAVDIQRQADAVGVAREEYQALTQVFERYNLEARDVQDVLSVISDRAEDAMRGTKSFKEAFGLVNIEAKELEGLEPEEIFFKFAEGIRQTENDVKRLTAAERLLGGELGQKLMPVMQEGGDNIREMTEKLANLGTIMGDETVRESKEFRSTMFFGQQALEGLLDTIAGAALPTMNRLIGASLDWFAANRELVESGLTSAIETTADFVSGFFEIVVDTGSAIDDLAESMGGWENVLHAVEAALAIFLGTALYTGISSIVSIVTALASTMSFAAVQAGIMNAAVAAIPVAIGAIIAAVGLLIEDIYRWTQGQESLIGDALESYPWIADLIGAVGDAVELVWDVYSGFYGWLLSTIWSAVPDMIKNWYSAVFDFAADVPAMIKSAFTGLWDSVEETFFDLISTVSTQVADLVSTIGSYASSIPGVQAQQFNELAAQLDELGAATDGSQIGAQAARAQGLQKKLAAPTATQSVSVSPTYNIQQRDEEPAEQFAGRLERRRRQDEERGRRQSAQFFAGGAQY